jgi:hypothetical protein
MIYGVNPFYPSQEPIINKRCFGTCGNILIGAIDLGENLGACFLCRQDTCPYEDKRTPPLGTLYDGEEFCVRKLKEEEDKP